MSTQSNDPNVRTMSEALDELEADERAIASGQKRWGRWAYDPQRNQLILTRPGSDSLGGEDYDYWLPLGECETDRGQLDWIRQIAQKNFPAEVVGDFVRALDDIVGLGPS